MTRTLENGGTVLWTGAGPLVLGSAVITNRAGALFEARNAAGFLWSSGANRFDNAGTFRKSVNSGTTTFVANNSFKNYHTVEIQKGILAANGGYTSVAGSVLNVSLGGTSPATGYGQLQVAGTVTLGGTLWVTLAGGFLPTTNDAFTVVTAGTRNGTFARFAYPSNQLSMVMSNTPNSGVVHATGAPVTTGPSLLMPELSGTDVRLWWTSVPNTVYRIEFNPNLNLSNWTALAGDVTATTNLASKSDSLTATNRFYRVRVLP